MDKKNNRIVTLFNRYISNIASDSEEKEFLNYIEDPLYKDRIKELLSGYFENQIEVVDFNEASRERILNYIFRQNKAQSKHINYKPLLKLSVAAAVVLLLGITFYLYRFPLKVKPLGHEVVLNPKDDPNRSKAYLVLASGDRIILSDSRKGIIASESGITVTKVADGQLVYTIPNSTHKANSNLYNTVEIPRGSQYQIILPDGTKVWLNAASSLKYPVSFSGLNKRQVDLKGEGYFEVSKDKVRPFIVLTDKQAVEVLGTHFNINAYSKDITKTTLLEGSVKISGLNRKGDLIHAKILKPGQMATNDSKEISISDIPYANNEIAWKNGYFVFDNANIKDIMEDLCNWYDMDVEYQGDMSDVYFNGNYLRSRNVLKLLKSIEMTNKVYFKIEGRRVIVIKRKDN